ncbi:MAG: hypothetical protein ACI8Z7_000863 [Candidatus Nanohaloarchaea archaeon]|jgi:hypothetical protein
MSDRCKNKITLAIEASFEELNEQHEHLIDINAQEEAVTFHLARILYDKLEIDQKNIDLDREYNKKGSDSKSTTNRKKVFEKMRNRLWKFKDNNYQIKLRPDNRDKNSIKKVRDVTYNKLKYQNGMRSDILIHERSDKENDSKSNIFAAEVKKNNVKNSSDGSTVIELEIRDIAKILYLTHPDTDYHYNYGSVIASFKDRFKGERIFWIEYSEPQENWEIERLPEDSFS